MQDISFTLAFLAGLLSFLSPCVLPLIPSYVSFITGISFKDLTVGSNRKKIRHLTITNSLAFIAGFSVVFIALGVSSSAAGKFFFAYMDTIGIIGGILVIIFGLFIAGFLKLDFLMSEKKVHLSGKPAGYIGTFIVGMTFAAGWTPCIGPILGAILVYAGSKGSAPGHLIGASPVHGRAPVRCTGRLGDWAVPWSWAAHAGVLAPTGES